ncbi:gliding motility-associated C-terminal domain-containing protein [Chitinophaga horti]|uniref:Gliding motility-associated C-terminal domain-containing protein n=1 Tax=Chitinophaga horti TaxID=2920382 RepID=A0ABY6JAY1_9BACT|nr:gliding motility-associated C-terminal domain-containing protein [Chitinophaga horti]UYQ95456.1 gliding motility-associated C-terminal domain-containing protein [Chitinophaga horti]
MNLYFIKLLLLASFGLLPLISRAQMPVSPCGPSGGKRADVTGVEMKYSSPGGPAPSFTIPEGVKSVSIYISSETGITNNVSDYAKGDEDFITVSAIIDLASNTSSGVVNYAKNTNRDGSGTNVYGWSNVPVGAYVPQAAKMGDATPDLNNVKFTVQGNVLTVQQSAAGLHSSYYVQYLSPFTNSLNLLGPQVKTLLHGNTSAHTDLVVPVPAGANVVFISGKGTNASYADLNTADGTEEGYANLRFTIDLDKQLTNGFITLANGGSVNRRSTYIVSDMPASYNGDLLSSGHAAGDFSNKLTTNGAVGVYNPKIYVANGQLIIKRDAAYARDFDDAYVVEFYTRTGKGMSAEFVNSDIKSVPKGQSATSGVSRTFTIPPGTNAIYLSETGNAVNTDRESNENSLEAYAYIDLANETATGYFYQQVGLSLMERRDDNFAFKGVPLNNSSARSHRNTVGFKGPYNYDISFSLSADKSQLTVTTRTGLANPDYQLLLSADYYGSKPDIAFKAGGVSFSKISGSMVKAEVNVCNPGSGNSNGGMPVAIYAGNPTLDTAAVLLFTGNFPDEIRAGDCKTFDFTLDLSRFSNLNIALTIVANDDGSYVAGGIGHAIGRIFSLDTLGNQHTTYQECFYGNNLITVPTGVNNAPVIDPDPDKSSGLDGAFVYLDRFVAGSTMATDIADDDLSIIDPDASAIVKAIITLTEVPDGRAERIVLKGSLPAGISISGDSTKVVVLSGPASQADYITALKQLGYINLNHSPDTNRREVTITINDGIETSAPSRTFIDVITNPRISVTGNTFFIDDNRTTVSAADGTSFGTTADSIITHTFYAHNTGTGHLRLDNITVDGAAFSIAAAASTYRLRSGDSTFFAVRFNPSGLADSTYKATVRIINNDADTDRADYTFSVEAQVVHPQVDTVPPVQVPVDTVVTVPPVQVPIDTVVTVLPPVQVPVDTVITVPPVQVPVDTVVTVPPVQVPVDTVVTVPPVHVPIDTVVTVPPVQVPIDTGVSVPPVQVPVDTVITVPPVQVPIDTVVTVPPVQVPVDTVVTVPPVQVPVDTVVTVPPVQVPVDTVITVPPVQVPVDTVVTVPPVQVPVDTVITVPPVQVPVDTVVTVPPVQVPVDTVITVPPVQLPVDTVVTVPPVQAPADTVVTVPPVQIPVDTVVTVPPVQVPVVTVPPVQVPVDTVITAPPVQVPVDTVVTVPPVITVPPVKQEEPVIIVQPRIHLVKTAVLNADNNRITYNFTVTNSGNVTLHSVTIIDKMLNMQRTLPANLEPNGSASLRAIYNITAQDRANGQITNTAVVTGLTPDNNTVSDTSGTSTNDNLPTITNVPGLPIAVNDQAETRVAIPVTVPVLDNDDARMSRFNKRTVSVIARAAHGSLLTNNDGTVQYTPDRDYSGEDQFTYQVQDEQGFPTNIATVRINIVAVDVQIPTLFTPNGDGRNDAFEIRGLNQYAENELIMMNRWGNEVYRQKNYQQNWRGNGLSEGTYYYLLRVKKNNSSAWQVLTGYTTLMRKLQQ